MSDQIIDELTWRGLIAQSTDRDALRSELKRGPITLYAGFDPTAPSLHAGHLVPLLTLRRFQLSGHRPILLAGGATGMIGDPRDVGERTMNSADTVANWAGTIRSQLERFVEFNQSFHGAIIANNMDWTGTLSTIEFLRDIGKHFSINVMLARDTVKRRLHTDGISYTEFSYMLLQANDFVHLRRKYDCILQIGGSDQWGNIVGGVELNRRIDGATVHAMTVPLITSADGKKFGKSTGGGSLWLDPDRTSPYVWYQYFFNTDDTDVEKYLRWFTFLSANEIADVVQRTKDEPHRRWGQKRLAAEMTTLVHGAQITEAVELASRALFGQGEIHDLDENTLRAALLETGLGTVPSRDGLTIVDFLVIAGVCESKGAARRVVREGGAYINNQKIVEEDWTSELSDWLFGKYLLIRRGKRTIAGIELSDSRYP